MAQSLVELHQSQHAHLKVRDNSALKRVSDQHMIGLKVTEVAQAQSEFPVFFTQTQGSADSGETTWGLSAITGLEVNHNLFVQNQQWDAIYVPTAMRTYPLFLMPAPEGKEGYSVGISPDDDSFTEQEGEALFNEDGAPSDYLNRVTTLLQAEIKNEVLTYQFVKALDDLKLIRPVNAVITFEDGSKHTLRGLSSINEEKLIELSHEAQLTLVKRGFLAPIYGMLFSMYQLHSLVKRHNLAEGTRKIFDLRVELPPLGEPSEVA